MPIDFGFAFDSATEVLGAPEFVPFRLTPQLVRVLGHAKERGFLKLLLTYILNGGYCSVVLKLSTSR